jgi:predicted ATPase
VIRAACVANGGVEVDTQGDAFFFAFPTAPAALAAASDLTDRLAVSGRIRVRVGVHTGAPLVRDGDYVGHDVHKAARIAAAGHGGQVLVSAATASLVDAALTDLGEHRFKDFPEPERVYQLGPGTFPPLKTRYRGNLPTPASPLIGRDRELELITDLLSTSGARLVTLTGVGGTGKTRLALEAAASLSDQFPDGVFFVGLAPLREVSAVRSAVAEALGLGADADVPAWLGSRRVLLVLDNLEHLRGVEVVVEELLRGRTVVLATSRGPLRLSSEHELPIDSLAREAAVELFVSRAAAAGRQIAADATVGEICRRLDDLPLALELAAARVRLLSPASLLRRLDESLSLLTGGARDLPERQQTLRAAIAWSHELLAPEEQAAFRRLSVFRGSFTLEAAEAIAGADLDHVASLLEQSLLKPFAEDRYYFLETLRAYARERLEDSGEREEYALRHARWYLDWLEESHPQLYSPRYGELLATFVAEEDNLRAMLAVLLAADPREAVRATDLLFADWKARRAYAEGRERLAALLHDPRLPAQSRTIPLLMRSELEFLAGDDDASEATGWELLGLSAPGEELHAFALLGLALIAAARGRDHDAIAFGRDALAEVGHVELRRQPGFRIDVAGVFRDAGLRAEARSMYMHAADEVRGASDPLVGPLLISNLSWLDLLEQRYEAAAAGFRQARDTLHHLGHAAWEAETLRGLALALVGLGRRAEARAALASALDLVASDAGPTPELTSTLLDVAFAAEPADVHAAARLAGAVTAVPKSMRATATAPERALDERFQQQLIAAIGEEAWRTETASGAQLALEEAIELARLLADPADETREPSA